MSDLTVQQAAEKAFQAEIILFMMKKKKAEHMEDCEIEALISLLQELIGDVGVFLGEEESRAEVGNV